MIDDEIRMLIGHRRIADAMSLQARALDEARCMVARRVDEYRPAAPLADGLGLPAPLEELANGGLVDARLAFEDEVRGHEPFVGGAAHVAVPDLVIRGHAHAAHAV